jgi:hypothetical protein
MGGFLMNGKHGTAMLTAQKRAADFEVDPVLGNDLVFEDDPVL